MADTPLPDSDERAALAGAQPGAGLRLVGGRYRLTSLIGTGAMGAVWRAWDELLRREVAVKEIRLRAALTVQDKQRLYQRTLREAQSAARLKHRAVVTVYDVVEESGHPWIVMELIDGDSLEQLLRRGGPLSPARVADIGRELLSALAAAHSVGVLHRDVKPANVLLQHDGSAVLTDFGIAVIDGDPQITQAGMVVGTPAFMAPERVRDNAATPAADLWSLGATLYAAVEGKGPFDDRGTGTATMMAIADEDPPQPVTAGPLAPVITALLSRDPAQRPGAAAAMDLLAGASRAATAAQHRQRGALPAAPRRGRRGHRPAAQWLSRKRTVAVAAAVAVIAIAVPLSVWTLGRQPARAHRPAGAPTALAEPATPSGSVTGKPSARTPAAAARSQPPPGVLAPRAGLAPPAPGADSMSAGAGLTAVAAEGPQNSLDLYYLAAGGAWKMQVVSGPGSTYSAPAVFTSSASSAGPVFIAAQGPGSSLRYYHGTPGKAFASQTVAGAGTTYATPAIYVRAADPTGEVDIAAEGAGNSLDYYYAGVGGPFTSGTVAGSGTTYSAPAMYVRTANPVGEVDIVTEGASNSLDYYFSLPGSSFSGGQAAGAGTTYSAPAIYVRANAAPGQQVSGGEADVAAEGPQHSLTYYYNWPAGPWYSTQVDGNGSTFSAPSIWVQEGSGEADIAAEGPASSLTYYTNLPSDPFVAHTVAGGGAASWAPALAVTPGGQVDIVAERDSGALAYYTAAPGTQTFGASTVAGG